MIHDRSLIDTDTDIDIGIARMRLVLGLWTEQMTCKVTECR